VLTSALACELFKAQSLPRSDVTLIRGLPKETDLLPVLLDDGRREGSIEIGVSIEPPHVVVAKLQFHDIIIVLDGMNIVNHISAQTTAIHLR